MQATKKARWQQATALVSLSTAGAMTGISFAHSSVADLTSPTRMPVKLLAQNKPAASASTSDSALRAAIVKSAQYYLRLAQSRSPSDMESPPIVYSTPAAYFVSTSTWPSNSTQSPGWGV